MNIHNDINNDIKFLVKSEIRLKILKELIKRPSTIKELVKRTKITYSSVSGNVSKLEKNHHIQKINDNYHVTPMAEVYLKTLMDFKNSFEMVNNYNEFWNKHNIHQLSMNSIKRITDLRDSKLIETTPIDIYKTHNTIRNQMVDSYNIKAIFPYLHPDYPGLIERVLRNKGSVELIVPQNVLKELMIQMNGKTRKSAIKRKRLKIYHSKKDLNLYLTICDKTMGLGLFKSDGSFDQNRILVSDNFNSYIWANELFEHIKNQVV